ncbi:helix-turn-helix domain-containing protein [Spirillospora sp. CA-294931]|uniref:helix-turn-helix domain-containing protein n=1 Tax=Spirillospora sp. CA-294931 TaxID=3240042 RepID=UPI003D8FD882
MEFAGALRQAIRTSGLTLERIRHRLAQRGLTVSVATLSYWQRGRSRPRSRAVVAMLEEILQVPPGTLTELLDDPVPAAVPVRGGVAGRGPSGAADRGRAAAELWPDPDLFAHVVGQLDRSGDHRLERLSTHDVYHLDDRRRPKSLAVREVLRAAGDDVDRVVCVHPVDAPESAVEGAGEPSPDPVLTGLRYCRPGRVRAEGGLLAFELVFDRVLAAGDTAVVEYEVNLPADAPVQDAYGRRFSRPVRDYLAIVRFHRDMLPARCYGFAQEAMNTPRERVNELWIGTSGSAHLAVGDVRRGILGLEWEWE